MAKLARISLTDEEAEKYRGEIEAILGYVDQLNDIDTTGVKPTSQVTGLTNVAREDTIDDYGVDRDGLLKNAPDTKDGYVKVRRVL